jgi:hypothetical protein
VLFRKIYWPVKAGRKWHIRCNKKSYKRHNQPNVIGVIKAGRVRWLGHLIRADDSNPCKKVTFIQLYGTRRIGRPSARWPDDVDKDLKRANVSNWKMKARDRSVWRNIFGVVLG